MGAYQLHLLFIFACGAIGSWSVQELSMEKFLSSTVILIFKKSVVASNKLVICKDSIARYDEKSFNRKKSTS